VKLAEKMVASGKGLDLLPWERKGAPWGTMSAQAYASRARVNLDMFGVDTPKSHISMVRCPLFICFGTQEGRHRDGRRPRYDSPQCYRCQPASTLRCSKVQPTDSLAMSAKSQMHSQLD